MKYVVWYIELLLSVIGFSAIMILIGSLLYGIFYISIIIFGAIIEAKEDDHE